MIKVFAADGICNPAVPATCQKSAAPESLFARAIGGFVVAFLIVSTLFTLFHLLLGGFGYITSGGDKSAIEIAKQRIQNALFGLFLVAAAWAIFIVVAQFFGLSNGSGIDFRLPTIFGQ
ncbi:MAG: hypothetical protein UU37_C0003G0005 [Candidatus Gottesmanbacteria bacterium GW2011_GWA2_41_12]|uniref:Uncharacterized protein n=2 Tax=Candidatus Gottesmaniibacteriota TaxID=1752720 RepID=A0A0G0ULN4_9BACT|nr:MAG: hypothetical protein UT63_C0014G0010 [Candidatus Gottesmanbacteria bacterium GW2011_GWC2_39_8]KKR88431.1 MAG: hypothetical protein UU37_C0003G0005 [Candidatus Gottesmanbacteria bacterium GW2011_GWA2_41_12]